MKLKEFDLDAPHCPKDERKAFRARSRALTALFERCFGTLNVVRGWKVLVECVPDVEKPGVRDLIGVLTVQVPFDVSALEGLDPRSSQERMLSALEDGIQTVALSEGWPVEPFARAADCVREKDLKNEWWWGAPRWNRDRTLKGQVWCAHEFDAFRAWLVIAGKDGTELVRSKAFESEPSEFAFVPRLGVAKWTGPKRFSLMDRDGIEVSAAQIPDAV